MLEIANPFSIPLTRDIFIGLAMAFGMGALMGYYIRGLRPANLVVAILIAPFYSAFFEAELPFVTMAVSGFFVSLFFLWRRPIKWALSLRDFLFALRHKTVFEDIKSQEDKSAKQERQYKKEYQNFKKNTNNSENSSNKSRQSEHETHSHNKSHDRASGSGEYRQKTDKTSNSDGLRAHYLKTMGLNPDSKFSKDEMKRAYRERAKEAHPDMGGSASQFHELTSAYEWLTFREI